MEHISSFLQVYPRNTRLMYTFVAVVFAILVAGFWSRDLADGFGRTLVAGGTIGDTHGLADEYDSRGGGFGFVFAAIAGLAATFTACNCVVFAMIPGLTCSANPGGSRATAWHALGAFTASVLAISAVYGLYIGFLGPQGIEYVNQIEVRHAQSFAVFTALGLVMLIWGMLELGYLDSLKFRTSQTTRDFFNQITVKATILGTLVGMFTVGRPYPVFRDFLVYAASAKNPAYGAAVMMIQGLGQITVMILLFLILIRFAGKKLGQIAVEKPYKFQLISGLALVAGGTYFIYYWGMGRLFDAARWGEKLGWYS
jgi:hypothetical protein